MRCESVVVRRRNFIPKPQTPGYSARLPSGQGPGIAGSSAFDFQVGGHRDRGALGLGQQEGEELGNVVKVTSAPSPHPGEAWCLRARAGRLETRWPSRDQRPAVRGLTRASRMQMLPRPGALPDLQACQGLTHGHSSHVTGTSEVLGPHPRGRPPSPTPTEQATSGTEAHVAQPTHRSLPGSSAGPPQLHPHTLSPAATAVSKLTRWVWLSG